MAIPLRTLISVAALLLLSACAVSGPKHADIMANEPAIPDGYGRLYVYRNAMSLGTIVQPSIYLDGQKIGDSKPNSFIVRDVLAGTHQLSASTETDTQSPVVIQNGLITYIQTSVGMGFFVGRPQFEQVTAEKGKKDIADLHMQDSE